MTTTCPTCGQRVLSAAERQKGASMGGKARAAALSPERRSEIARNAALVAKANREKRACQKAGNEQ